MQDVFNWFYTFFANQVSWLFSMQIVPNVSIGAFIVVLAISGLVISNLMLIAKRRVYEE